MLLCVRQGYTVGYGRHWWCYIPERCMIDSVKFVVPENRNGAAIGLNEKDILKKKQERKIKE